MNNDKYWELLNQFYDTGRLNALPPEVRRHLKKCGECRRHYQHLEQLDSDLSHLSDRALDDQLVNQALRQIKSAAESNLPAAKKEASGYLRRAGIAAAILLIVIGFWLFPRLSAPHLPEGNGFYLHSAEIETKNAGTVVYQDQNPDKPLIVWLY